MPVLEFNIHILPQNAVFTDHLGLLFFFFFLLCLFNLLQFRVCFILVCFMVAQHMVSVGRSSLVSFIGWLFFCCCCLPHLRTSVFTYKYVYLTKPFQDGSGLCQAAGWVKERVFNQLKFIGISLQSCMFFFFFLFHTNLYLLHGQCGGVFNFLIYHTIFR